MACTINEREFMKEIRLIALFLIGICGGLRAMDNESTEQTNNIFNASWFYDINNPYYEANQNMQKGEWQTAEDRYRQLLKEEQGSMYDQAMARINLASARLAQGIA